MEIIIAFVKTFQFYPKIIKLYIYDLSDKLVIEISEVKSYSHTEETRGEAEKMNLANWRIDQNSSKKCKRGYVYLIPHLLWNPVFFSLQVTVTRLYIL